jgi:gliding motility-associated-like protein
MWGNKKGIEFPEWPLGLKFVPFALLRSRLKGIMIRQVSTKIWFLFFVTLVSTEGLVGQNIAPNPDLEFYTICPTDYANPGTTLSCVPWHAPTWGSTDYFNSCSNPSDVGVPDNDPGWQYAHSGQGYCGFLLKAFINPLDYREYLTAPLLQPLIGGKWYSVSFYVNLADKFCGLQQIGAYFSVTDPPYEFGNALPYDFIPQVETNGTFLSDTANWMLIEGCFQATGGEAYVTIGNFHTDADTPLDPSCTSPFPSAYYYIDDIYVGEVQPGGVNIDLGNDITACYSADLISGITGVDYYWSTGETTENITVTNSGTYYLSVYDGCEAGVDSITVLITNQAPVEINPGNINICQGGSVSILLDPNAGNYLWNDGSTSSTYTINSIGIFSVTLDDGCDITSDTITVNITEPPAPFSIGGDTLLCTGSEIEIFLDPGLGDFTWQNGSNSNSFIITSIGEYAVTISNMCGETSATLSVDEITPEVLILPVSTYALCNGQTLEISLDTTLGPYVWQDGSIGSDYLITTSGLYSVTMSHYCGPSADSVLVTAYITPLVDFGDTIFECPGDTLILSLPGVFGSYTWQDGSNNDSLIVTMAGTYGLSVGNICGIDFDTVSVLYEDVLVPVNLGPDIHLCPGDSIVLNTTNPNAHFLWQDNSSSDSLLVKAAGIYYVAEFNSCLSFTDTVEVFIENMPPSISLPDQITLCQGIMDTLDPGVTGVIYAWNDGSQNATLTISNPGNYSLTVSNSCGSDIDTILVVDGGPVPSVSLGIDTSLCAGETILLQPNSNTIGNWLWPDGSTNSSLVVFDSGTIDVIISNACGIAYDTIAVSLLDPIPPLDLGVDTSLCPGESITLSINIPSVDIEWSDGSDNSNFIVNSEGIYYANISNSCGISSDTIHVISLPAVPSLDLGPDIPLCPGEQTTLTQLITGMNYLWQDGSTGNSFLADHDQLIVLTISNICGMSTDSLNIILNNEGPDVDLGDDVHGCDGDSVNLVSNISNVNYLWQDGSTNASFIANASGEYYLQVSNACGTDTDTVIVDIHGDIPQPDLGPDTILCEGETLMLISNADSETSSLWQNGSSQLTFPVNAAGTFILTQSNHCGQKMDSIHIDYQPLPMDVDLGNDTLLCPGETLLLNAPLTSDAMTWQDGSNGTSFLATQAGVYNLSITNDCGTKSDEITIEYGDSIPPFWEDEYFGVCPGSGIELYATQEFPASYVWNTGATTSSIFVVSPGFYTVSIISNCAEAEYNFEVLKEDCDVNDVFFIPNIISPNNDNINDVFVVNVKADVEIISIDGSIFDRWGNLVFSSKENPFTWNGKFHDEDVMSGVYVFSIQFRYVVNGVEHSKNLTGDITVIK